MDLEVLFGSEASGNKPVFVSGTTVRGIVKATRANKRDAQALKTHVKMQIVGVLSFNPQAARLTSGCYVKEMPSTTTVTASARPKYLSKSQSPLHPTLGKFERLIFASPVFDVIPDGTEITQLHPISCKHNNYYHALFILIYVNIVNVNRRIFI